MRGIGDQREQTEPLNLEQILAWLVTNEEEYSEAIGRRCVSGSPRYYAAGIKVDEDSIACAGSSAIYSLN